MTQSSANDRQVGGRHYQTGGEQHWDRIWRLYGPGYFVGCITKYLERYPDKHGYQDLLKAQHFLEKLIELEGTKPKQSGIAPDEELRQRMYDWARAQDPDEGSVGASVGEPVPPYLKPPGRRF